MTTLHVNLPDELAAKLREKAAEMGSVSINDYVTALLQEHIEIHSLGRPAGVLSDDDPDLEAELERRLNDPRPDIEITPQFWEALKQRVRTGGQQS